MTINDLLGLQPSSESMGRDFRTVLDPNEVETFGQNAASGLANALGLIPSSLAPAWYHYTRLWVEAPGRWPGEGALSLCVQKGLLMPSLLLWQVLRGESDLLPRLQASNYRAQIVFCKRCCCPNVISA